MNGMNFMILFLFFFFFYTKITLPRVCEVIVTETLRFRCQFNKQVASNCITFLRCRCFQKNVSRNTGGRRAAVTRAGYARNGMHILLEMVHHVSE